MIPPAQIGIRYPNTAIQFLKSGTKGVCNSNAMGVLDVEKSGINQFLNPTD